MLWGHGQPGVTWDTPKAGRVCVVSTTHGSSSSSICQHVNISETLGSIMLILGHNNKSANAHF